MVVGRFITPQYRQETLALIDSLGVGDSVELVGFTSDVAARLRQMDLFVLPSTGPEGLPMVVLEAMAHGVPVIGSNVAGIADVLRDGVDGRVFAACDDEALAAVVEDFIQGRCDWQNMRRRVHQRHAAEFTAERMVRETADVYHAVLDD